MSRSRNTQLKYRKKQYWNQDWAQQVDTRRPYDIRYPYEMGFDFDKNPGWWDHLFSTEKNRRKERDLLRKLSKTVDLDGIEFDPWKKPKVWYW